MRLPSGNKEGNRDVLAVMPAGAPDGLAVDENGCVWVACYEAGCVTRFTPAGEALSTDQI